MSNPGNNTTFSTGVVVTSGWLNSINDFFYDLFQAATTVAEARAALGIEDGTASITVNNLTVEGDTVLGDSVTGGNTTVNLLTAGDEFTIVTEEGDTFIVDGEGNTTINVAEGDTFLVTGEGTSIFETDVTFLGAVDMSSATSVDYLDGSITINDLSSDLVNLILSGGAGSISSGVGVASGDGRLSLAPGVKVMTVDYTGVTTVYYVGGVILNFNDGSNAFQPFFIGELSQTLASSTYSPTATSASKAYDLFGWKDTLSVTAMTRSGSTVTVTTSANHNITTDAVVFISGADQSEYNGYQVLTSGSGSTFTFTISTTPVSPATGTITAATARLSRGPAWKNAGQVLTNATNATPIVITATAHGLATGDPVNIAGVQGNTAANGDWTITKVNDNSFSLDTSVGNGSYATGTGAFASRGVGAGTTEIELIGSTYVNSNDITNGPDAAMGTYLGSIYTNASNQLDWKFGSVAAGGGEAWFSVWNVSNRVDVFGNAMDSTNTWAYTTATARALNNSATNRVSFFRGLNDSAIEASCSCLGQVVNGGVATLVGIDSTTTQGINSNIGDLAAGNIDAGATAIAGTLKAEYAGTPGLGFHFVQGLEISPGPPSIGNYFGRSTAYTSAPVQIAVVRADLVM